MKPTPYIGITGAATREEVSCLCSEFHDAGYTLGSAHIPMLGLLVSHKTLNGAYTNNLRYPNFSYLNGLLAEANCVMPMIHYNSKEMNTLSEQVSKIFENSYDNFLCRALQLNIAWPDISQAKKIKNKFPEMQIALQISEKAMAGRSAKEIANKVRQYGATIDYALLDPSGGRGIPFSIEESLGIYMEISEKTPMVTVGFAGGFTGENAAERLATLIEAAETNWLCIDAEGGLRDKLSPGYGDDLLNLGKAKAYLQNASKTLRQII